MSLNLLGSVDLQSEGTRSTDRFFQKSPEQYQADADLFHAEAEMDRSLGLEPHRDLLDLGMVADRLAQEALETDALRADDSFDEAMKQIRRRRAAWLRGQLEGRGFRLVEREGRWLLCGQRKELTAEIEVQAREWRSLLSA